MRFRMGSRHLLHPFQHVCDVCAKNHPPKNGDEARRANPPADGQSALNPDSHTDQDEEEDGQQDLRCQAFSDNHNAKHGYLRADDRHQNRGSARMHLLLLAPDCGVSRQNIHGDDIGAQNVYFRWILLIWNNQQRDHGTVDLRAEIQMNRIGRDFIL